MRVTKLKPCAGYPSQTEAIEALMAEGLDRKAIVERTGLKLGRVDTLMSHNRNRIRRQEQDVATWPPEKLAKAQRLFDATMTLIAEALEVTVPDLLVKVSLQRLPPAASAPAEPEPSREDDEAELAALEAAELDQVDIVVWGAGGSGGSNAMSVMGAGGGGGGAGYPTPPDADENSDPVATVGEGANGAIAVAPADPASREVDVVQHQVPAASGFTGAAAGGGDESPPAPAALLATDGAPIFRLKRRGEYVDKTGVGSTRNIRHAWTGTARQIEAIYRRRPEFLEFDAEPVYA